MSDVPPGDAVPGIPGPPDPDPGPAADPPIPETPRRRRWPVVAGVVALVLVAGGAFAAWRLAGTDDVLLETVPSGSDIVVTAYLDPAASQKMNLLRMVQQFPDVGDEDQIRQQVDEWLDEVLAGAGLSHTDLEWVGSQALVWVDFPQDQDPSVAFVLSVDDPDAARAAADRVRAELSEGASVTETTHDGATVFSNGDLAWTVTDDLMILASEPPAVEATLDTASGATPAITGDPGFVAATDALPADSLGIAYIAMDDLMGAFEQAFGMPIADAGASLTTDAAASVSATPDGLVFDMITRYDPNADPALLDELTSTQENLAIGAVPGDAVMTMAFTGLARGLEEGITTIEEQDPSIAQELEAFGLTGSGGFLEQLRGDMAMGVIPSVGDAPVGGVVTFGIEDDAALDTFVDRLIGELENSTELEAVAIGTAEHDGVSISYLADLPLPVAWAAHGGVAIVGSTPGDVSAALDAMSSANGISTTDRYEQAVELVGGDQQFMMVDIVAALALVREAVPPEELTGFEQEAAPYLEPIDMVVFGGTGDRTLRHDRFVIAIPGSE